MFKKRLLKMERTLRIFLFALIIVLGTLIPSTPPHVFAASCYGSTCKGLNPQTMGCGADAKTGPAIAINGGRAENRYSQTCNAEWERTINQSGVNKYAAGSIRYGCANFCLSYNVSSPGKIAYGQNVYTPMVGPDTTIDTRSCGKTSDTGPIAVPLPINNNCTGVG
jgi:hypothetical protein